MTSHCPLAVLLAATLLGGCGSAQTAPTDPSAAPARGVARTAPPSAQVPSDGPDAAALALPAGASLDDRVDLARQIADGLRLRSDRVQRWLRDSRRAEYGQRTDCLDDMLSQVHAVERRGTASHRAARVAATREDLGGVDRELARLRVCDERSRMLVQLAHMCGKALPVAPIDRTVMEVRTETPNLPPEHSATMQTSSRSYSPGWRWQ